MTNIENYAAARSHILSQLLCKAILRNGIRESLEITVRLTFQSWIRHGHWSYGFMNEGRRICKSSDEQRCATEAKCCVNYLGEIVCFLAWLYCAEGEIQFAASDCCSVIADAMTSEIEKAGYGNLNMKSLHEPNGTMEQKYGKSIKLRFLLSLNTEFSRPLQLNIGQILTLSADLLTILGS